jgi:hypothetical protein
MTETLELPGAAQLEPPEPAAGHVGSPFFADLVRAHYAWERAVAKKDGGRDVERLGAEYATTLRRFCDEEGELVEAYWCVREASAVALTVREPTRWQRLVGERDMRLHRVSNWLMPRTAQKLVDILHDADDLAILSSEILRGTPKRIALRWAYEIESHVLAFAERTHSRPTDAEVDEFVADAAARIAAARRCYDDAADKVARMVYVAGMLGGIFLLPWLAVLAALLLWLFGALHLHDPGTQAFFACIAAGALGALVSVLSRMASAAKFSLHPDVGRRALFILGIYRPLVGAIFGVALYFLLQSGLLSVSTDNNKFATFVVAAFLGGFSERFVRVMLHTAESTAAGAKPQDSDTQEGKQVVNT